MTPFWPRILRRAGVRPPRVLIVNDCRDQDNFGAHALMDGLVGLLNAHAPAVQLSTIPSHWVLDMSFGMSSFVNGGKGMRQPAAVFPQLADQFERTARDWLEGRGGEGAADFLARLRAADLVVLNGEGSMYRTNLSAIRELFLAWFAKTQLGLPTLFVNGLVHLTLVMPILPAMVRKTFRTLDAVAVREPCSERNLKEFVPELRVYQFPDSAFFLEPAIARESRATRAVHEQLHGRPFFCFDPGAMPVDHSPPHRSALYHLIRNLKQLVPQAVLISSAPADNYIELIARETDSLYVNTFTRYREFMALVRDAQFVISGRYHNPILAAIVGCPSITLASTSHKVHGACETIGLIGSPYDGTDLCSQLPAIEAHAAAYVARRAELGRELQARSSELRAQVSGLGELLRRHVPVAPLA